MIPPIDLSRTPPSPGRAGTAGTRRVWRRVALTFVVAMGAAVTLPGCGGGERNAVPAPGSSVAAAAAGGVSAPESEPAQADSGSAAVSAAPTVVPAPPVVDGSPLQGWLAAPFVEIAHHGGSASWPPASPLAYRNAIAWSSELALEFSARRTADGVWVGSEDASTGAVYGLDLTIADSTWDQLSTLRSIDGGQPMSRLDTDLLDVAPGDRVVFVDDKDDAHVGELLDLLDQHGGPGRAVIKSYWKTVTTPTEAHRRGYQTWGYYYSDEMAEFTASQPRFDLLGINADAPAEVYQQMLATGKRVIAHIIRSPAQADRARSQGATGLMVADVEQIVPQA